MHPSHCTWQYFLLLSNIQLWTYHGLFIYLPSERDLGYFQVLVIINNLPWAYLCEGFLSEWKIAVLWEEQAEVELLGPTVNAHVTL